MLTAARLTGAREVNAARFPYRLLEKRAHGQRFRALFQCDRQVASNYDLLHRLSVPPSVSQSVSQSVCPSRHTFHPVISPRPLTLSMANFAHTPLRAKFQPPALMSHMDPSSATTRPTFVKHIFGHFSPCYISATVDPIYAKLCTHTPWGINFNLRP